MGRLTRVQQMFQRIGPTIGRFPLTTLCLLVVAGLNSYSITDYNLDLERFIATFIVGAWASAVAQIAYERFYSSKASRLALYGGAIVFALLYHILIASGGITGLEETVRTALILFGLVTAFVWIPSIKSKAAFHHTLLATLRAAFLAFLFTLVLMIGVFLLLGAVDQLLFELPSDTYFHFENPVFSVVGPLLFLAWIPRYPGKWLERQEREEQILYAEETEKAITPPKSLEWLISYIVIPLILIFTVILIVYLLQNITGDFWTDNLLEPMLVSYTTIGMIIYLLASTMDNAVTKLFLRWFPKILVPLVLFQTVASFLRMRDIGLTHGRYFTLMAGIFTIIAGTIFIVYASRRNGWVGALLLLFIAVAVTPPVDAFTTSRNYHVRQMEAALQRNNMLQDGQIVGIAEEDAIPQEEKVEISQAYRYLNRMDQLDKVSGIEIGTGSNADFVNLFGFYPVTGEDDRNGDFPSNYRTASVRWSTNQLLFDVEGFDQITQFYFNGPLNGVVERTIEFEKEEQMYRLDTTNQSLMVENEAGEMLVEMNLREAFEEILRSGSPNRHDLSIEEATITAESEEAILEIILLNIQHDDAYPDEYGGDIVIKVGIR